MGSRDLLPGAALREAEWREARARASAEAARRRIVEMARNGVPVPQELRAQADRCVRELDRAWRELGRARVRVGSDAWLTRLFARLR